MNFYTNIFKEFRSQIIIFLLLFLIGILLRAPLINPPSLWLDDLWASSVIKSTNVKDFFLTTSHTPILLSLITKIIGSIVPDKEIGPQLFPLLASCSSIPLLFLVAFRTTNSVGVATISAFLLAFNPMSIEYASRVKPYSGDILIAIVHIYFMATLLSSRSLFHPGKYTIFCIFSSLLSQSSLIIIAGFYMTWFSFLLVNKKYHKIRSFFCSIGTFSIFFSLLYWFVLRKQMHPMAKLFWQESYMPITDPSKALSFLVGRIQDILQTALNVNISFILILLLLSVIMLIKKKELRFLILFYFFLYVVAISLSGLKLYPMSGQRTDLYLLPFNILFLCTGFKLIEDRIPEYFIKLILILALVILFFQYRERKLEYPNDNIKPLVRMLERNYQQGEAIVCWSHANWGLGYYTKWKILFVPTDQFGNNFAIKIDKPHFYLLNDDKLLHKENLSFLQKITEHYNRVWFIASFYDFDAEVLCNTFLRSGFHLSTNFELPGVFLRLYKL